MIIIVYVMDSLRPDFLSCYGYEKETSPNIDALSQEGVLFTQAFAQATWTRPSGASLLSSLYPSAHGVLRLNSALSADVPLLPELLREQGFRTMAVSAIGNISPDFGFGRGFETFVELYKDEKVIAKRSKFEFERMGWDRRDFKEVKTDDVAIASSEDINDAVIPVLENLGDRDLFLLVWSLDTHDPYYHRDPRMARFCSSRDIWFYKDVKAVQTQRDRDQLKRLYEDMIYYNDTFIGRLIRRLRDLKLMDQTLFVLTGDHGEFFGEHGLNSHADLPYDEVIRVPLIMKFPHAEFHGVVSGLVQHIDLAPTLLDYLKLPARRVMQGKSLMPLLREQVPVNDWTFAEYHLREDLPGCVAMRSADYKYMEIFPGKLKRPPSFSEIRQRLVWWVAKPRMLFSLADDPGERSNIARLRPGFVRECHGRVKKTLLESERRSRFFKREKKEKADLDRDVARQLQGLGYFD